MNRAVFLDRDGVLNQTVMRHGKPYPPASLADLVVLPGVSHACQALHAAGYLLIMVTNQPDIARGTQSRAAVDQMNGSLQQQLGLDAVHVCPHDDRHRCTCRKPQPGMLTQAAGEWAIDLARSFLVGDRWRDIEAGRRAGVRTVFIDYAYQETRPDFADHTAPSLAAAAGWILARSTETCRSYCFT